MPEKPIRQMTDDEVANFACPKCSCTGVMFDGYNLACRCGWRQAGVTTVDDLPKPPEKSTVDDFYVNGVIVCPKCKQPTLGSLGLGSSMRFLCMDEGCKWTSRPDLPPLPEKPPEKPKSTAVPTCPECGNGLITGGPPPNHFYLCMDQGRCRWRSRPVDATANPVEPPEKPEPPEKTTDADEPVRLSEVELDVERAMDGWEGNVPLRCHPRIDDARERARRFFRLVKREHRQAKRDREALSRAREILRMVVECDRIDRPRYGPAAVLVRNAARLARVELGLSLNSKPDATPPSEPPTV